MHESTNATKSPAIPSARSNRDPDRGAALPGRKCARLTLPYSSPGFHRPRCGLSQIWEMHTRPTLLSSAPPGFGTAMTRAAGGGWPCAVRSAQVTALMERQRQRQRLQEARPRAARLRCGSGPGFAGHRVRSAERPDPQQFDDPGAANSIGGGNSTLQPERCSGLNHNQQSAKPGIVRTTRRPKLRKRTASMRAHVLPASKLTAAPRK